MAVLISNPPEQGQMVSVRSRNWMVTDIARSTLPPARLQAGLGPPQRPFMRSPLFALVNSFTTYEEREAKVAANLVRIANSWR